jgi:hypothetical protein
MLADLDAEMKVMSVAFAVLPHAGQAQLIITMVKDQSRCA